MLLRLLISCLLIPLAFAQEAEETGRSQSQTGLFVVHGKNARLRAVLVQEGESLGASLDKLTAPVTGDPNSIVVDLYPPQPGKRSRISPDFFVIPEGQGGGVRLQINVRLAKGNVYLAREMQRRMLEMLIIERSLRGRGALAEGEQVSVPPWLIDGLLEAILWQEQKGDRRVYSSLAKSGGWMAVEKLVEVKKVAQMDALGRELFRASSGALVMALLDQADGAKAMAAYLTEAATHEGEPLTLIRRHFAEVNLGRQGLEKWWALAVAKMAEKPLTDSMTIPETEARLMKILRIHLKDAKGRPTPKPLESWEELALLTKVERYQAVRPTVDLLTSLSYRCFPTYREVITGYLQALSDMVQGNPDEVDNYLANLGDLRRGELNRYEKVTDLLDWYHLNTVKNDSGEFEDYLRITRELRKTRVRKDDPISDYVDKIQKVYERTKK